MFADDAAPPATAHETKAAVKAVNTARSDGGNVGNGGSVKENALTVKDLWVNRPPFYPLERIRMEARRGEITGIAGMRESGVETLELALAGLLEPESGSIEIAAASNGQTGAKTAYIGLGGSAQAFAPSLSVRDNLILHEHRNRVNRYGFLDAKALAVFAKSLVEKAGLSVSIAAPASSLSGGMQARIIAERELAKDAGVLLLSDPSAGLDLRALNALIQKIRAFADSDGAVLLFLSGVFPRETGGFSGTNELAGLCDRLYALEGGRLYPVECGAEIEYGAEKETRGL